MEFRVLGSKPGVPEARNPALDVRKTVTILFIDIVDSSRLSLTLDPEALRNLLARYFDELSAVIRRHGGVVGRYIGDAIMAGVRGAVPPAGDAVGGGGGAAPRGGPHPLPQRE